MNTLVTAGSRHRPGFEPVCRGRGAQAWPRYLPVAAKRELLLPRLSALAVVQQL